MKMPPYLKPGDTIALVCPAGYMPLAKAKACISTLKQWGYKVVIGKTLGGKSKHYFSGSAEERLADVQKQLDDPTIKAMLCGRGGYGTTHLLDQLDWKKFKKNPKWIIGFSDITILLSYLHEQHSIASIHGPMANAFNHNKGINRYTLSLKDCIEGKPVHYSAQPHIYNSFGKSTAQVVGGNLSLLAHAIGTNADVNTKGKILFFEDVGEQRYNIERMLLQLKRAGKLNNLKGLVVGGFTDSRDTDRPFGKTVYQLIHNLVCDYKYPISFGFPISHEKENVALIIGSTYRLEVSENGTTLSSF